MRPAIFFADRRRLLREVEHLSRVAVHELDRPPEHCAMSEIGSLARRRRRRCLQTLQQVQALGRLRRRNGGAGPQIVYAEIEEARGLARRLRLDDERGELRTEKPRLERGGIGPSDGLTVTKPGSAASCITSSLEISEPSVENRTSGSGCRPVCIANVPAVVSFAGAQPRRIARC